MIEAEREQADSHEKAYARYVAMNDDHFKRRPSKKYPILNLRLAETEELVAFHAKRRPAVVVGTNATSIDGLKERAPSHHVECRVVMAPVYGLRSDDDVSGFGSVLATRIWHLMYRQFFPFFAWRETRTHMPPATLERGVIRLDRLQFINPSPPGLRLMPVKLSAEAMNILHATLWAYLHAEPWEELVEIKDLLRSMLPKEAEPVH
ncbi:MAG: hypothetical protein U0359_41750 [Byssovorax sp.]